MPTSIQTVQLNTLKSLVKGDFNKIDQLITQKLQKKLNLIQSVCHYMINGSGKRVRPLLLLLTAKALGYLGDEHIKLATIMEFLHTATLLHDDVIDQSKLRRHKKAVNIVWNNETSILIGDFLHALSFQMIVELGNPKIMQVIADSTMAIVTGEVMQLIHRNTINTSEQNYMEMINRKTARLFTVATQLAGIICNCSEDDIKHLAEYGLCLGMAYQIIDDALDYSSNSQTLGKNIGDDLAEGKATLPFIYAAKNGTAAQNRTLQKAFQNNCLEEVIAIIQATHALEYTHKVAKTYVNKAIDCLNQLKAKAHCDPLYDLAQFILTRDY